MRDLVLHLKHCYFKEIESGCKKFEYRLCSPYWIYRLSDRTYDRILFWDGYKKRSSATVLIAKYRGYEVQTITHPHFGPGPVKVFAIYAQPIESDSHNL